MRARLPEVYQILLRLKDRGLSEADIARQLQVLPEAVGPLIRVAEAKLLHLQREPNQELHRVSE